MGARGGAGMTACYGPEVGIVHVRMVGRVGAVIVFLVWGLARVGGRGGAGGGSIGGVGRRKGHWVGSYRGRINTESK